MPTVQGAIGGTVSTVRLFRMGAHTRTRAGFGPLPFTIVEAEFRRLSDAWGPIMVNGSGSAESPGVLDGPVMLIALRELLLDGATPYSTRDAILAELVERAQVRRGVWFIPPVGLLLPGLRPLEGKLAPRWWVDSVDDVQAELLAGLMAAIAAIRPRTERLASRLLTAAETHTRRMMRPDRVERRQRALTWEQLDDASAAEVSLHARRRPPGHAELLLAGAVAVGVARPPQWWPRATACRCRHCGPIGSAQSSGWPAGCRSSVRRPRRTLLDCSPAPTGNYRCSRS
jgi:hypothetical protein